MGKNLSLEFVQILGPLDKTQYLSIMYLGKMLSRAG